MKQISIVKTNLNQMSHSEFLRLFELVAEQFFSSPHRYALCYPVEARQWLARYLPQLYVSRGVVHHRL